MIRTSRVCAIAAILVSTVGAQASGHDGPSRRGRNATIHVAGSGLDWLSTAIVHSTVPTPTGMVQTSTETVDLTGDLNGRALYHVTSATAIPRSITPGHARSAVNTEVRSQK